MGKKIMIAMLMMSSLICAENEKDSLTVIEKTKNENVQFEKKYNQISARYSNLSGYGLAYQRNLFFGLAVRVTGWAQFDKYREFDDTTTYELTENSTFNIGLDLQKNIISENKYRVYGFGAGGFGIRKEGRNVLNSSTMVLQKDLDNIDRKIYAFGGGIGFEYFFNYFSLDLGLGYKYEVENEKDKYVGAGGFRDSEGKQTGVGLTTGISVLF